MLIFMLEEFEHIGLGWRVTNLLTNSLTNQRVTIEIDSRMPLVPLSQPLMRNLRLVVQSVQFVLFNFCQSGVM